MRCRKQYFFVFVGMVIGSLATWLLICGPRAAHAANDRNEGFIICTGAAGVTPRSQLDGVWMLDYKQGRLLATIVDRSAGQNVGFANLDLAKEFGINPSQSSNYLMTTGQVAAGQAALYLVETTTGKFGVYTLGPSTSGQGVTIMRHELTSFRKN